MPTISVIIPAYNQSQYLGEAIRSVLAQTYADFEILVVDDGSTDETRSVTSSFADSRVHYIYRTNGGLSAARNTGIRHARGSFLTYLDSDDRFLPENVSVLLAAFEMNPDLGLVAGQTVVVDELGHPLGEVSDRGFPQDTSELLLGNPVSVGSMLLRREWQSRVGFFDENLRSYEDWDMWLRLALAGCPMGWVRRPVLLYRFHAAQMTRIGEQMTTATFAVLDKTCRNPGLPEAWRSRRDEAYSRAYLRAAAKAYSTGEVSRARQCMREAIHLNPELCADDAEPLARLVAGWANYPKTTEPLLFLERVYQNLPEELDVLRRRRKRDLAQEALQLAFGSYQRGDVAKARSYLWRAVSYRPQVLLNRGVMSIILHPGVRGSGTGTEAKPLTILTRTAPREGTSCGGES